MEQKSGEEPSEKQPADSPSKQGKKSDNSPSKQVSKDQKSADGASGKQLAGCSSNFESNGEAGKNEKDTETQTILSDKRKLEAKEQKYATFAVGSPSKVSVTLSPTKRKCVERHVVASEKIQQKGEQLQTDEPKPGPSSGIMMQGSPRWSPTNPGTSKAGIRMQGSPKQSPVKPGTSDAGNMMHGSPKRSPTKRTYKEREQSFNVDELEEKRLREESGYQSDSALDLRKDFKKQIPSSTQYPEFDCQPTSSDKMGEDAENRPKGKHQAQSSFPRDSKGAASEVTSSDGGVADVSSTSSESAASTSGGAASGTQGCQAQNETEENNARTSPGTSPRHSGARPKEASCSSSSVEYISVTYQKCSPSKRFYGGPTIKRISPQQGGDFKVPPPPPPTEEQDRPIKITNALENLHSLIVNFHAIATAEQLQEEMRREREEKARKEQEQRENFARAKAQAAETTRKLREKEARAKGDKSASAETKTDIASEEIVAGPSTSGLCSIVPSQKERYGVKAPLDKRASPTGKEKLKSAELAVGRENLPSAAQSTRDENSNIMVRGLPRSTHDDGNANKSDPCTVQTSPEGEENYARQSTGNVVSQRPRETPRNPEYFSLQQLVPQINEISLNDSLENISIADSEQEDDNVDLQNA